MIRWTDRLILTYLCEAPKNGPSLHTTSLTLVYPKYSTQTHCVHQQFKLKVAGYSTINTIAIYFGSKISDHMTKMAAMAIYSIYDKALQKPYSSTKWPMIFGLGTWFVALWMWALPSLFKWLSYVKTGQTLQPDQKSK